MDGFDDTEAGADVGQWFDGWDVDSPGQQRISALTEGLFPGWNAKRSRASVD